MRSPFIDDAIENDRNIKNFEVECKCSAEVIWLRLPKEWTEAEANQQITDAKTWFKKYCIELTFKEFAFDPPLRKPGEKEKKFAERMREFEKEKKKFDDFFKEYEKQAAQIPKGKIQAGIEDQLKAIQMTVENIYGVIVAHEKTKIEQQKKKSKGEKIPLVVMFLDEWYNLLPGEDPASKQGRRRDRISSNHVDLPLIGLDRYDRASPLLLVHELAHGLRKPFGGDNVKCIENFLKTNTGGKVKSITFRRWDDHYSGTQPSQARAILFIDRFTAFQPYQYTQNHVFSVREYLTVLKAGYVSCTEGCDVKQETLTPFYLSDVLFDLGGVAHLTPGLRYPLRWDALFPAKLREIAREMGPDSGMVYPPALAEPPSSFRMKEALLEQPQVSIPPVKMPVPIGSVPWSEMPTPDRNVNVFYLPELTLDITGVAHMTPGLRETAFSRLSLLAFNLPAFEQMQQTLLLRMNGSDEETKASLDEKIMAFGELEEDATFSFVNEGLVDIAFKFVEENVNPKLPRLVGKITKEQLKAVVDTINPEWVTNFTCTGNCENFDSIQIEQQAPKLYGPKSGGVPIPTLGTVSLTLEADVITAPAKTNNSCITEEELDYRRKKKEYDRKEKEHLEALQKYAKKKAEEGNPPLLPKLPDKPQPPEKEKRSKPGRQVQQDFIIKWDVTISGLGIEYTQKLYKQTVTRYSSCCPVVPGAIPLPPGVPEGEGEKEDSKEEQKEFFFAGFEDVGETISDYSPPSPLPPDIIPVDSRREEIGTEEQGLPVFVAGLEEIAISAEALAAKFMSADIATSLSQPPENAASKLSSNEG